ncbi:MAG: hypothetical protein HYZ75_17210, partial [Elusimicrobia bacterium]|nr:hypothetical protein [Elusimicrobiota bacterium]
MKELHDRHGEEWPCAAMSGRHAARVGNTAVPKTTLGAVVLALAAGLLAGPVAAQTVVKPGDTGTIELPLRNAAAGVSAGKIENLTVSVSVPAAYQSDFTITGITIENDANLPPTSFELDEAKTFVVAYTIGPNAPDGNFDAVLTVNTPGQAVRFNPAGRDTLVSFPGEDLAVPDDSAAQPVRQTPPFALARFPRDLARCLLPTSSPRRTLVPF